MLEVAARRLKMPMAVRRLFKLDGEEILNFRSLEPPGLHVVVSMGEVNPNPNPNPNPNLNLNLNLTLTLT